LDDWIYCTVYIHTVRNYRQYGAISLLNTFHFTVTYILGFSVFTSRILATDLSQSHCNFKSHMEFSCHSVIHFLPLFCNCQFEDLIRLFSTTVLYSDYFFKSKSKSHCDWGSVSQSVSKSWCRAPCGGHDQIFITVWQLRSSSLSGALSDERTGLSFVHAAGPCQRSISRVRVPWDSWPYFTVYYFKWPSLSLYNASARTTRNTRPI
jgi:hypothetical protein